MKKIGLLLLLVGFGWLCSLQLARAMHVGIRPVLSAQIEAMDAGGARPLSRTEVSNRVLVAVNDAYDAAPSFFVAPGLVMLVGGLLMGRKQRSTASPKAASASGPG